MKEKIKRAFIIDKDEFVRLSLKKILHKYGFQVEEVDDISDLEKRNREIKKGMILADLDIETIEKWLPFLKRWNERLILMSPLVNDQLIGLLKGSGINRIIKKPVEPELLKGVIKKIPFPDRAKDIQLSRKKIGS